MLEAEPRDSVRVVIVDDHELFREGVAHTLGAAEGFEVVGQGSSAADAVRLCRDLLPDVILLDLTLPGGGLAAARPISAQCPATKIVILTVSEQEDDVLAALKAGARAYVLKGVSARELVAVLQAVAAGEVWVTPSLAASLLQEMTNPPAGPGSHVVDPLADLTEREREVLELVALGHSNKEIGRELSLTEKTVKFYMTNILQKLHVRNRVEAAVLLHQGAASTVR